MTRQITERNISIAVRYKDAISDLAAGVLLSGSNAWGANYAVTEKSDIDLLVITDSIWELENVIKKLVSDKLLRDPEYLRFEFLKDLYKKGLAEQFSVIANYEGVPVSIDFFTVETLRKIASFSPMGTARLESANVRFIKEFRINPPRVSGYSLDNLCSSRKLTYYPIFSEIKNANGIISGYLSETVIDALTENKQDYFLGVMSFYLIVAPVVLFDRDGEIVKAIGTMKSNIKNVLGSRNISNITRQERMSKDVLEGIFRGI